MQMSITTYVSMYLQTSEKSRRSQRSPQPGYNVQETSKTASSAMSSASKRQSSGEDISHEKGVYSSKKTSTTVQEEKSMSKQMSQNTRLVSGPAEEVAPIVKTEKIKYSPSAQQSPLPTKSVPVIATETRKVAYTETRPVSLNMVISISNQSHFDWFSRSSSLWTPRPHPHRAST